MAKGGTGQVLLAEGLVKRFKEVTAVAGIDLEIRQGECLALLGPNGAGKTTTVEMLEGLQKPDEGRIRILGYDLATDRRAIMNRVGVLLQETHLYKRYSVRETLELFASFFDQTLPIDEVLSKLQLQDKADTWLMKLSGGQKQRVYIGCCLINNPDLLFLDEPTTGLDPQARRHLWDLLADIKGEGRSILLTSHYMEEAEYLADRVAIIDHGKVIAEGAPKQLIHATCGDQILWVALGEREAESTRFRERFTKEASWFKEAVATNGGYEITTPSAALRMEEIFAASKQMGIPVRSLQMRNSTLEDVFLKLTGRSMRDG